jgi:glucose/arabinose dehydrogenase
MKAKIILNIAAGIIYSVGCLAQNSPVETQNPNSDYKPAKAGQTRVAGIKTKTAYKVDKIAEKLGLPWAVIPLPDGRLLITEKKGSMQI